MIGRFFLRKRYAITLVCLLLPFATQAQSSIQQNAALASEQTAQQVYNRAINVAAQGNPRQALTALQTASELLQQGSLWQQRMQAAAWLLAMRQQQQTTLPMQAIAHLSNLALAQGYMAEHAAPQNMPVWPVAILGTLLPGAGHAMSGRWHDAMVAALLVWPMLLLTLWAMRRKMGPVTVFFALISIWLWSGSVFSAVSLVQRGFSESYLLWWQGVWQASALPGMPW